MWQRRRPRWFRRGPQHRFWFRRAPIWSRHWSWGSHGPPRREQYIAKLERYQQKLRQRRDEIERELRSVDEELASLRPSTSA